MALWRLLRLVSHVVAGVLTVWLRFPGWTPAQREERIARWSRRMLAMLGVAVQSRGGVHVGPKLVVANHVSWLDIAAIHAVMPHARFVSKADVKHWPVVSMLVEGARTLYIERASKRDALRVVHQTAEALQAGDSVAFFPEGTTGPGPALLPFHGNLLQAAVVTGVPVQPLVLRWHEPGERFSTAARYIGDTTLVASLWSIARARGLAVDVQLLDVVDPAGQDRRELAERLSGLISQSLG